MILIVKYIYTHTHRKHFLENVCARVLSHVWLFATHQVPLAMEFSRQEHLSRLPFPAPGHPPDPGIKPVSSACAALVGGFFTTVHLESPQKMYTCNKHGIEKAFLQKIVTKRYILANFLATCFHRISVTSISLSVV